MVTKNVGNLDANIRRVLGVVFIVGGVMAYSVIGGSAGILALLVGIVLAIVMFTTAATRVCPLYMPVGVTTKEHP